MLMGALKVSVVRGWDSHLLCSLLPSLIYPQEVRCMGSQLGRNREHKDFPSRMPYRQQLGNSSGKGRLLQHPDRPGKWSQSHTTGPQALVSSKTGLGCNLECNVPWDLVPCLWCPCFVLPFRKSVLSSQPLLAWSSPARPSSHPL